LLSKQVEGSASSDCQSSGFVDGIYILLNEEYLFEEIFSIPLFFLVL